MKELEKFDKLLNSKQTEQQVKKDNKKEHKLIGSLRPKQGHTLWQINEKTLEVKQAEYENTKTISWWEALTVYRGGKIIRKVVIEKDCVYISALNQENALKRYLENKGSATMGELKPIKFF